MNKLKVSCHMMQKNERTLLEPWIVHHASLFGLENLFIFDNGSTDKDVLAILSSYADKGLNVEYSFHRRTDFERKGDIIANSIIKCQDKQGYDFSFPLDCDELIGLCDKDSPSISPQLIELELMKHKDAKGPIQISYFLFNNPYLKNIYLKNTQPQKFFFAGDSCLGLDIGFHAPKSKYTQDVTQSNICYFHFHNRRYHEFLFHASQKVAPRAGGFSYDHLVKFKERRGAGYHVVEKALLGEQAFKEAFLSNKMPPFQVTGTVDFPDLDKLLEGGIFSKFAENDLYFRNTNTVNKFLESFPTPSTIEVSASGTTSHEIKASEESPLTRPRLSLNSDGAKHLTENYSRANTILEYGCGGSTAFAADLPGKTVFSVESDSDWVAMMQRWFQQEPPKGKVHLQHVDIGPTKEWGHPKDESRRLHWIDYPMSVWERPDLIHPDVVLIDGRFRVGCFLATLMNIRRPTTILFDDYGDRPHYHVVEELLKPTQHVGRMAVFDARPRALHPSELRRFGSYFFRPE